MVTNRARYFLLLTAALGSIVLTCAEASALNPVRANVQPLCSLKQQVDFLRSTELSEKLNLAATAVHLEFGTFSKHSGCSGTFISDEGHILSAAHCFEKCIARRLRVLEDELATPKAGITCPVTINGVSSSVRVLLTSKCTFEMSGKFSYVGKAHVDSNPKCDDQADLAVVIPTTPSPQFRCMPIADKPPKIGDPVLAMGFPSKTTRPGTENNSHGDSLYFSAGQAVQAGTCQQTSNATSNAASASTKDIPLPDLGSKRNLVIQTTADIVLGSSGGPLFNSKGEIIGVASFVGSPENQNQESTCKGSTFFANFSQLTPMSEAWGSADEIKKMSCSKKKASSDSIQMSQNL